MLVMMLLMLMVVLHLILEKLLDVIMDSIYHQELVVLVDHKHVLVFQILLVLIVTLDIM